MNPSQKFLSVLADNGAVDVSGDVAGEEADNYRHSLLEFSDFVRVGVETLRGELFSESLDRIERQVGSIQEKLHSFGAFKLNSDCTRLLKHLHLRGAANSTVHLEKLVSDLLAFSINIQVADHLARQEKETPSMETVVATTASVPHWMVQLREALELFDDEKSLQVIQRLETAGLTTALEPIKKSLIAFDFPKALTQLDMLMSRTSCQDTDRKPTILAVDDIPQNLAILKSILAAKCKFVGVTSGEAALKYLETNIPDIYILDIDMPKMTGFELVEAIKLRRKTAPTIFLTANATIDYVTRAFALGVTDFLVKPCNEEAVTAKINKLFYSR